jgi:hypothetical protein
MIHLLVEGGCRKKARLSLLRIVSKIIDPTDKAAGTDWQGDNQFSRLPATANGDRETR